jgi:YebC/PmpR family DNA-binding regulatory protein
MSGHSKWANIRVKKTAQDARRGKVFTRHARLVEIAARAGGSDPKTNSSLRAAIDNAKADSVPNDNIERAIKKEMGKLKGEAMQEIVYAAYGPGGVACLIECLSDNRNRTLANVKMAISKHGGNFAETSSVAWMFVRRGQVLGEWKMVNGKLDELELELIDIGAEDFSVDDDVITIVTSVNDWTKVRDFLKQKGATILSAGLSYIPTQKAQLPDEAAAAKLQSFIDAIEEDDDVSAVHTNAEF